MVNGIMNENYQNKDNYEKNYIDLIIDCENYKYFEKLKNKKYNIISNINYYFCKKNLNIICEFNLYQLEQSLINNKLQKNTIFKRLKNKNCGTFNIIDQIVSKDNIELEDIIIKYTRTRNLTKYNNNELKGNRIQFNLMKSVFIPIIYEYGIYEKKNINEKQKGVYCIMQYIKGNDLMQRLINNFNRKEEVSSMNFPLFTNFGRKLIFMNIVKSVKSLHDMGYTHYDLKPENIMIYFKDNKNKSNWLKDLIFGKSISLLEEKFTCLNKLERYIIENTTIKLIDFGFTDNQLVYDCRGTYEYRASEIVYGDNIDKYISDNWKYNSIIEKRKIYLKMIDEDNKKSDIWSLGIILYVISYLSVPENFSILNEYQIVNILHSNILTHQSGPGYEYPDESITFMIENLLKLKTTERPTCEEILQNSFFHELRKEELIKTGKYSDLFINLICLENQFGGDRIKLGNSETISIDEYFKLNKQNK